MSNAIRLGEQSWAEAEALLPVLRANPLVAELMGEELTATAVLRMAVKRGLRTMRAEFATPAPAPVAAQPAGTAAVARPPEIPISWSEVPATGGELPPEPEPPFGGVLG